MLRNVKGMLMPVGTELSLIDFMDSQKRDDNDTNSKERWIIVVEPEKWMPEGYLSFHTSGEVRIRANSIAYSRQLHLYAWDRVVAMLPCNKASKKHWIHPDILNNNRLFNYPANSWHRRMIEQRLQPLLANVLANGDMSCPKTSLLT